MGTPQCPLCHTPNSTLLTLRAHPCNSLFTLSQLAKRIWEKKSSRKTIFAQKLGSGSATSSSPIDQRSTSCLLKLREGKVPTRHRKLEKERQPKLPTMHLAKPLGNTTPPVAPDVRMVGPKSCRVLRTIRPWIPPLMGCPGKSPTVANCSATVC